MYHIRRALWICDRDAENALLRFERVRRNGLENEFLFVESAGGEVTESRTVQAGEPLARHPSYALSHGLSYEGPVKRRQVHVQLDELLVHQLDGWATRMGLSRSELIRRAIARELERLGALDG